MIATELFGVSGPPIPALRIKEVNFIIAKKEVISELCLGGRMHGEGSRAPFVRRDRREEGGVQEMNVAAKLPGRQQAGHNYRCILTG